MTDRNDINRLTAAQREIVALARQDLDALFSGLPLHRAEVSRDMLLEIVPQLVREYGNLAAVAAAEWYESVRPAPFNARLGDTFPDEGIEHRVRSAAGGLFTDDPAETLATIQGSMQRYITYSGRQTVARNVTLDPLEPRFARVPSGAKTCVWCAMLASRGFVYRSEITAGMRDKFHDDCNCCAVVSFDRDQAPIEGYDPDRLFDRYEQARSASGSGDIKEIAAYMRRMFPDEFTDGVHPHDI